MSTIYYIDSENVGPRCMHIIPLLKRGDKVVYAYSPNAPNITMFFVEELKRMRIPLQGFLCKGGTPNAMDFQLCARLGEDIASKAADAFCLVSRDHGYDVVISMYEERGIKCERFSPPESDITSYLQDAMGICGLSEVELRAVVMRANKQPGQFNDRCVALNKFLQAKLGGQHPKLSATYNALKGALS